MINTFFFNVWQLFRAEFLDKLTSVNSYKKSASHKKKRQLLDKSASSDGLSIASADLAEMITHNKRITLATKRTSTIKRGTVHSNVIRSGYSDERNTSAACSYPNALTESRSLRDSRRAAGPVPGRPNAGPLRARRTTNNTRLRWRRPGRIRCALCVKTRENLGLRKLPMVTGMYSRFFFCFVLTLVNDASLC